MGRPVEILLIEDNPGDVFLTKQCFSDGKIKNTIHVSEDGELALDFLYKRNDFKDAITPDLILLDLNLPKVDGKEVLADIKQHDTLRRIPVVVMTSSREESDIVKTYDLHANCYIVKPIDMQQFAQVVSAIENFWFSVVVTESSY